MAKGFWASEMQNWDADKMRQVLSLYGKSGLTENTYNYLVKRVGELTPSLSNTDPKNASFNKVADPTTKIYPVLWDKVRPLYGDNYVNPNIQTKDGYDFEIGNADWKSKAAKYMRENKNDIDTIKRILYYLARTGAYDNQLYELDTDSMKRLQARMKLLGKYTGPIDGKISDQVIQSYRNIQVDGKYGSRTELALTTPDKLKVAPARIDNTYSYGSYLKETPGHAITGGQYYTYKDQDKIIQAPDNVAYPAIFAENWKRSYGQDAGSGNTWWNLISPETGKSIRYAKSDEDKQKIITDLQQLKQNKEAEQAEKDKLLQQNVYSLFSELGIRKNGGSLAYSQYLNLI